jgi:hypothetical protein
LEIWLSLEGFDLIMGGRDCIMLDFIERLWVWILESLNLIWNWIVNVVVVG